MSYSRRILKNISSLALARVVSMATSLVSSIYLARVLGAESYGILGFGTALLSFFTLVVNLGFDVFGTREIAREHERVQELTNNILTMRLFLAVVVFGLYAVVIAWIDKPAAFKAVLIVLGVNLFTNALTLDWVYQGVERMDVIATRQVLSSLLGLLAVFILVHEQTDVILAAVASVVALLINAVWMLNRYLQDFNGFKFSFNWKLYQEILQASLPIAVSSFMISIYYSMDTVMLGFMRTEEEVGWYTAAYKFLNIAIVPMGIFVQALLPTLSNAYGNQVLMKQRAINLAKALLVVGVPISATGMVFAQDLIKLIFGNSYIPASNALVLLMANVFLIYINTVYGNPLVAWNQQKNQMYAILAGGVINIILNFLLIPGYGIEGAALATLISEAIVLIGQAFLHFRMVNQLYIFILIRVLVATFTSIGIVMICTIEYPIPFLLSLLLISALFFLLILLLKVIDLDFFKKMFITRHYN